MQDVDVLVVERVAIVAAEIAHAVEENIVARGKAANGQVVALRAAFACGEADARYVAQRIAKSCRCPSSCNNFCGDDADGLREVDERLVYFGEAHDRRCVGGDVYGG